jgi:hypothetical protein
MSENKPWLDPENAEFSTGVHQFHIIKDVIKFLRKHKISESDIGYVRKGLNTVNYDVNPLNPYPKKREPLSGRISCGWTETETLFRAYYAMWYKGEYLAIVFTGKKKNFEIPNIHRESMRKHIYKIKKVVPDSRKRTRSGAKVKTCVKRKISRFEDIIR